MAFQNRTRNLDTESSLNIKILFDLAGGLVGQRNTIMEKSMDMIFYFTNV